MSITGKPIIVHCHGCFDLLHVGHIQHLQEARKLGDFLIVTVTADEFVNKGPGRPMFTAEQRCAALKALECVDYVTVNNAPNAAEAIRLLKPDLFVKGPDYSGVETPGLKAEKEALDEVGGWLVHTAGEEFHSTDLGRKVLQTA